MINQSNTDQELELWAQLWNEQRYGESINAIEKNLLSNEPHKWATTAWVRLWRKTQQLEEAFEFASPEIKECVGRPTRAAMLYYTGQLSKFLEEFPPDQIHLENDLYVIQIHGFVSRTTNNAQHEVNALLRGVELLPEEFGWVWDAHTIIRSSNVHAQLLEDRLGQLPHLAQSPAGIAIKEMLGWELQYEQLSNVDNAAMIALSRAWLKQDPFSFNAWNCLGSYYRIAGYDEKAIKAFESGAFLFPFWSYTNRCASAYINQDQPDEARRVYQQWDRLEDDQLKIELAKSASSAGHQGFARELLSAYGPGQIEDPRACDLMAKIELAANRPLQAVEYAQIAWSSDTHNVTYAERYAQSLRQSGNPQAASELIEKLYTEHPDHRLAGDDSDLAYELFESYEVLEDYEKRLEATQRAIDLNPNDPYLLAHHGISHWLVDEADEAIEAVTRSMHIDPSVTWVMYRVLTWTQETFGQVEVDLLAEELCQKYPQIRYAWRWRADQLTSFREKEAIYREAAEQNPLRVWPLELLSSLLRENGMYQQALSIFDRAHFETPGDVSYSTILKGDVYASFSKTGSMTKQDHSSFLDLCEQAWSEDGGDREYVFRWKIRSQLAMGMIEEAHETYLKGRKLHPDDEGFATMPFHELSSLFSNSEQFQALTAWYERDPFDPNRIDICAHYHSKWGGSPVEAVRYSQLMQERHPDQFGSVSDELNTAYSRFGDSRHDYINSYGANRGAISTSRRYIEWYESLAKKAREQKWVDVQFDTHAGEVSVTDLDGITRTTGYHPISAKQTLIKQSNAWVQIEYDPMGEHIQRIWSPKGDLFVLSYNDQDEIVKIVDENGVASFYSYNQDGKLVKAETAGVGYFDVVYNSQGEIETSRVFLPDGTQLDEVENGLESYEIRSQIVEVLSELSTIVRGVSVGNLSLESFRVEDIVYETLYEEYQQAEYGSEHERVVQMKLVEHCIGRIDENPDYARFAASQLQSMWEHATSYPPEVDVAVEILSLQLALDRKQFAAGLPKGDIEAWGQRRRWLDEHRSDASDRLIRAFIDEYERDPLQPAEPSLWLPGSDLDNSGYWRTWKISEMIPVSYSQDAQMNTSLYRSNGDLVVGTSRGLCVLRYGWWEWYAFDDSRNRFTNDSSTKWSEASNILALIEDDERNLWVGTGHGLFKIDHQDQAETAYADSHHRFVTQQDGMPSPRIDELSFFKGQIYAGGPKGSFIVNGDRLTDQPVRFIKPQILTGRSKRLSKSLLVDTVLDLGGIPNNAVIDQLAVAVENDQPFLSLFLSMVELEDGFPVPAETDIHTSFVEMGIIQEVKHQTESVLIGDSRGVWAFTGGDDLAATQILTESVDDAVWDPVNERLIVLAGGYAKVGVPKQGMQVKRLHMLPDQGQVLQSGSLHSVDVVEAQLRDGTPLHAVAISTDSGVLVLRDERFEVIRPFPQDSKIAMRSVELVNPNKDESLSSRRNWVVVGDDGLYLFEQANVQHDRGSVYDMVSSEKWGFTFIARGSSIDVIDHESGELIPFASYTYARVLELADDGGLYTHDGSEVIRFAMGDSTPESLFSVDCPSIEINGSMTSDSCTIQDMKLDSSGNLWVAAGARLYRWQDGMEPEVYSYFEDPAKFPSRSQYIDRIHETIEGDIRVVCSDERHLSHRGQSLIGGVLRYEGGKFVRITENENSRLMSLNYWLSYTPVDDEQAIVGTTGGFAYTQGNRALWVGIGGLEEPSYMDIRNRDRRLFMGTTGARIGNEDAWLFGCAQGVVGYHHGQWFIPDRLNRLLPDDYLSRYGSRHVYSIVIDPAGRVCVGTKLGLLIYDGQGDITDFLYDQGMNDIAMISQEQRKLRSQATVLIDSYLEVSDSNDERAQLIQRLLKNQERVNELERASLAVSVRPNHQPVFVQEENEVGAGSQSRPTRDHVSRLKKETAKLLREVERNDPSLAAMLQLKPLDLASLRNEIPDDQVVVQMIPSKNRLYLNVVSNDRVFVRTVEVTREELFRRVAITSKLLQSDSVTLRGNGLEDDGPVDGDESTNTQASTPVSLQVHLEWLYEQILRPIERDIESFETVIISPAGPLMYVPVGAFIRRDGDQWTYAIEDFTFGVVPDLYLMLQSLRASDSLNEDALVIGNPDGTLLGAEEEARRVHSLLKSKLRLLLNEQATVSEFTKWSSNAGRIHIATHGQLNAHNPVKSSLTFADRELLIYEIDELKLNQADLVVLSACESGVGVKGLEYATLARAFTGTGVSTTIATLWRVSDQHSVELINRFYRELLQDSSPIHALANAKRSIIRKGRNENLSPAAWAGYVVFGTQ